MKSDSLISMLPSILSLVIAAGIIYYFDATSWTVSEWSKFIAIALVVNIVFFSMLQMFRRV